MKLLLLLSILATCPQGANIYPLSTEIISVDYSTDAVTCADSNGNAWAFYGCEDWHEGDICALLMCDNATEEIYDDYIIDTHYCGHKESEVIFR